MAEPCIAANRGPRGAVFNPAASADTQAYIIVHTGIVEVFSLFFLFFLLPFTGLVPDQRLERRGSHSKSHSRLTRLGAR